MPWPGMPGFHYIGKGGESGRPTKKKLNPMNFGDRIKLGLPFKTHLALAIESGKKKRIFKKKKKRTRYKSRGRRGRR